MQQCGLPLSQIFSDERLVGGRVAQQAPPNQPHALHRQHQQAALSLASEVGVHFKQALPQLMHISLQKQMHGALANPEDTNCSWVQALCNKMGIVISTTQSLSG